MLEVDGNFVISKLFCCSFLMFLSFFVPTGRLHNMFYDKTNYIMFDHLNLNNTYVEIAKKMVKKLVFFGKFWSIFG